ncbi:MAG: hypothetical protein IPG53_07065 [Ignavibacteriales bacterium]|nr:hypothetical protein [Ignavibacteriales bacterium]
MLWLQERDSANLGAPSFNVTVNDSNGLSIRFSPLTTGDFSGTLTFASNDPDTPTKVVILVGRGTTMTQSNAFAAGWNLMSIPA